MLFVKVGVRKSYEMLFDFIAKNLVNLTKCRSYKKVFKFMALEALLEWK